MANSENNKIDASIDYKRKNETIDAKNIVNSSHNDRINKEITRNNSNTEEVNNNQNNSTVPTEKNHSKLLLGIICLLVIIIITLVTVLALMFFNTENSTYNSNSSNNNISEQSTSDYRNNSKTKEETSAQKHAENAKALLMSGDVNAAVEEMEAAYTVYPSDEYKNKLEEYKLYLPFKLYKEDNAYNITEDYSFDGNLYFDEELVTNNGKTFYRAIQWNNDNNDDSASIDAHYYLEGKYDTVSGTIFLPIDSKGTSFEGWFKVYGDGQLIYTSPKISGDTLPGEISFSVAGIQRMKISFYAQSSGQVGFPGRYFGVENLIAYKNPLKK